MPQMKPILWFNSMIIFSLMLLTTITLIFFLNLNYNKKNKMNNIPNKAFYWKW